MIRDPIRGWAWTRAFLGILADEIHVCGEEGAIIVLKSIAETTYENFEVILLHQNDKQLQNSF